MSRRNGFTLIELMVVIVIISLLIALIFPAVFGAISTARDAQVRSEISQLDTAIASFKVKFGSAPPSSITLYEWGDPVAKTGWYATTPNAIQSRAYIRRMFPQYDFTRSVDLDGNGNTTGAFTLAPQECLVFFLGGARIGKKMIGFSSNPSRPFEGSGGNRIGPFFEFQPDRLVDVVPTGSPGFLEYVGPLPSHTTPYIYLSSYDGVAYRTNDAIEAGLQTYYTSADGTPWRAQAWQIIDSGADDEFGNGGVYDKDGVAITSDLSRNAERDNISNFSRVRLVP